MAARLTPPRVLLWAKRSLTAALPGRKGARIERPS